MITEIKSVTDFKDAMTSDKLIVVDFFAVWCGPCMRIFPKIEALSAKYSDVNFYKINYDTKALKDACDVLKVTSLPTFCFFKNGQYLTRLEGAEESAIEKIILEHK